MKFLTEKVINGFPFKIKSIQTDGGSEFMKYFEECRREYNTPPYVLPPSSPKYNGRAERSARVTREEFYARRDLIANNMGESRNELEEFVKKYNNYRPRGELDYLTPMEYYEKAI
jgi:transposase InsO family protein